MTVWCECSRARPGRSFSTPSSSSALLKPPRGWREAGVTTSAAASRCFSFYGKMERGGVPVQLVRFLWICSVMKRFLAGLFSSVSGPRAPFRAPENMVFLVFGWWNWLDCWWLMHKSSFCLFPVFEVNFPGPPCLFFWLHFDAESSVNPLSRAQQGEAHSLRLMHLQRISMHFPSGGSRSLRNVSLLRGYVSARACHVTSRVCSERVSESDKATWTQHVYPGEWAQWSLTRGQQAYLPVCKCHKQAWKTFGMILVFNRVFWVSPGAVVLSEGQVQKVPVPQVNLLV